jgi:hypothetical protein
MRELEPRGLRVPHHHKLVATINHERMPVLLTHAKVFDGRLNGAPHVAYALAKKYPPGRGAFKKQDLIEAA